MEVDDVLADEMVDLTLGVLAPEIIKVKCVVSLAVMFESGHIANWGVQPDIKVLAGFTGDLEAKIGRIATDIPVLQAGVEPFSKLVSDLILQGAAAGPRLQPVGEVRQGEEEVGGLLQHRFGAGDF